MCYIIITSGSLVWFLCTLLADLLIASALVTPYWLIGPNAVREMSTNHLATMESQLETMPPSPQLSKLRYPSVGIYTRCKVMHQRGYHCGPFDLDGFGTDSSVYPPEWKAAMFFMSLGLALLTVTVLLTLLTCCRQSAFGKSIHNMTACAQVIAGISVLLAVFLHPLGWRATRVQHLCGIDSEPFYPATCSIGMSFYCAVGGILLTFASAGISLKAESSNMRTRVRLRVEKGSKLVCIP